MSSLTEYQVLERLIKNDRRNIDSIKKWGMRPDTLTRLVADCGVRLISARDYGDRNLLLNAEFNIRLAVKAYRAHFPSE